MEQNITIWLFFFTNIFFCINTLKHFTLKCSVNCKHGYPPNMHLCPSNRQTAPLVHNQMLKNIKTKIKMIAFIVCLPEYFPPFVFLCQLNYILQLNSHNLEVASETNTWKLKSGKKIIVIQRLINYSCQWFCSKHAHSHLLNDYSNHVEEKHFFNDAPFLCP